MNKILTICLLLLFVTAFAFNENKELQIRENLKPIAENNCVSEGKTFTGLGMNKIFYSCNGEQRGFTLKELEFASQEKAE